MVDAVRSWGQIYVCFSGSSNFISPRTAQKVGALFFGKDSLLVTCTRAKMKSGAHGTIWFVWRHPYGSLQVHTKEVPLFSTELKGARA